MKINWFSPLPPAETDIADFSMRALPALAAQAEIAVWTEGSKWPRTLEQHVRVVRFESCDIDWETLHNADVNVYNLGNDPRFHSGIWLVSQHAPGVVILHDISLQHLFASIFGAREVDRATYVKIMGGLYPCGGRDAAEAYWQGKLSTEDLGTRFPMTELALRNALGVVVHSSAAFDGLAQRAELPVCCANLPFPVRADMESGRSKRASWRQQPPYRLVVFGFLGPNRRLDAILDSLSDFEARHLFLLDVYGRYSEAEALRQRVEERHLDNIVRVRGFVSTARLDSALAGADLVINLRNPTMGEASGSQLRLWSHALPSLVTEAGWYAEHCVDTSLFVRPDHEVEDLRTHLRGMLAEPQKLVEMGQRGEERLKAFHSPTQYAEAVSEMLAKNSTYQQLWISRKLAERSGRIAADFLSEVELDIMLPNLADMVGALTLKR